MTDNVSKIELFWCGFKMGVLEKTDKGYVYNSNLEGEQKARDIGYFLRHEYNLWYSVRRRSKDLFSVFVEIIDDCGNAYLVKDHINPKASMWDKLVTISQFEWFPKDFYVQQYGIKEGR